MFSRNFALLIVISSLTFSSFNGYALLYQEQEKQAEGKAEEEKATKDSKKKPGPSESKVNKVRPEILAPVDALTQKEQDLTHYISAEKITPMLAGAEDFFTIINENIASNQKGVMILLADWGMSATSSNALNYLQKTLPFQGWTTIAIQPPVKPFNYPSRSSKLSLQVEENANTLLAHQEKLTTMMAAVMEKAKDYPGIFVVVSQGSHAILLANLYSEGKLESPSAMVLLSGHMNAELDSISFAKTLARSEFPVLDIYLSREHQLAKRDALIRKSQATKEMKVYYRQSQLHNNQVSYYPKKSLLITINGWLKSIGW
jgi:hypothetical protein